MERRGGETRAAIWLASKRADKAILRRRCHDNVVTNDVGKGRSSRCGGRE